MRTCDPALLYSTEFIVSLCIYVPYCTYNSYILSCWGPSQLSDRWWNITARCFIRTNDLGRRRQQLSAFFRADDVFRRVGISRAATADCRARTGVTMREGHVIWAYIRLRHGVVCTAIIVVSVPGRAVKVQSAPRRRGAIIAHSIAELNEGLSWVEARAVTVSVLLVAAV